MLLGELLTGFSWGDHFCRRLWRTYKLHVCSSSNGHVFCEARKLFANARKFFPKAKKFSEKFDTFRSKHFMIDPERVMNASLQVKTGSMHNLLAFSHELQKSDHVTLVD